MSRWEYNHVTLLIKDDDYLDRVTDYQKKLKNEKVVKEIKFIEYLNRLGNEGWELVYSEKNILPKIGQDQMVYNMFFKRQKA